MNVQSVANHFAGFSWGAKQLLNAVDLAHRVVGPTPLQYVSSTINKLSGNLVPQWNPYMPRVRIPPPPFAHACLRRCLATSMRTTSSMQHVAQDMLVHCGCNAAYQVAVRLGKSAEQ